MQTYLLNTYARFDIGFERGEGATLYDVQGRDYIDFTSGIGVNSVGHNHPRLIKAITQQAQKVLHTSNLYRIAPQEALAKELVQASGYPMKVFFANSGAEANEGAIKIARKYGEVHFSKKRFKIITLRSSFHGRTLATLKANGQEKFWKYFAPFPEGFVLAEGLDDVYAKLDDETCAVMLELIQGEGGIYPFPKAQIQTLAEVLQEKKILMIVDEVQSGVYRTGEFLASNLYEIEPDLITLAKGLGGGIPIGAVMCKHQDIFGPGDHGSTFGGNFLSTRVGLEILEILKEEKERICQRIKQFDVEMQGIINDFPKLFSQKVGIGLMVGLEAKSLEVQSHVIAEAMKNGVLVLRSGRNVVRFLPPLIISTKEISEGFLRLKKALQVVLESIKI